MDFIGKICKFCDKHSVTVLIEYHGGYTATFSAGTKRGHTRLSRMLAEIPGVIVEPEPWEDGAGVILVKPAPKQA